jgi:ABC-2 type transport system permease protein
MMSLPLVRIVTHEWRLLWRMPAAAWVCASLVAVVSWAAWNGVQRIHEQRATIGALAANDAEQYARIYAQLDDLARHGDPHPRLQVAGTPWYVYQPEGAIAPAPHIDPRLAEAGASEWLGARYAALPPSPAGAFAIGQSDLYPYYSRVTIRTRPVLVQSDEIENPSNLLNGRFDLAFVVALCWPLLVLPLIYNAIAEERESGTLALLASQPVPLRVILAVRLLLRSLVAVGVTLAASLAAFVVLGAGPAIPAAAWALWALLLAVNAMFWAGVAAIVSVPRWRSTLTALVFIACWLGLAVLVPLGVAEIASAAHPVPSRVDLINAVRNAGNLGPNELASLMEQYYDAHADATRSADAADLTALRGLAQQDDVDRRIDPILDAYQDAVRRQQSLSERLTAASPPLVIYAAVLDLAGTSGSRYRAFASQLDAYHHAWREYFYPLARARTTMTRALYEAAPRFTFVDAPFAQTARHILGGAAVVGMLGIGLLAVALRQVNGM